MPWVSGWCSLPLLPVPWRGAWEDPSWPGLTGIYRPRWNDSGDRDREIPCLSLDNWQCSPNECNCGIRPEAPDRFQKGRSGAQAEILRASVCVSIGLLWADEIVSLPQRHKQGKRAPAQKPKSPLFSSSPGGSFAIATQQMGYFQRNHLRNMEKIRVRTILKSIEVARGK